MGILTAALMGGTAHADTSKDALHQRLDSLSDDERKLLAPLMERGPVALVEFSEAETLPAVVVAGYVEADAARVADVIQHPERYPSFMHTLDSVEVRSRVGAQTSYKWTWRTGMLFLEGENRMTALPPPPDRPEQGYRIAVHSERGHLGEGRLMWRVFPAGPKRSMLVLSMRVDMRDANFVMRQLDSASRSINRSVNLSLCYVMMLGTKREAERLEGAPNKLAESVPFAAPALDVARFAKLLKRADIVLLELTQRGLGKVSILGRTGLTRAMLDPVMKNPELFGKSLVPGSYARVTKQEGPVKTFEWGISLPLIGTSGVMTLAEKSDSEVWVDAIEGSLKGGKWRFQTPELAGGEAVLLGYSLFDITQTSWLIQKIAELDPVMGHGLAAASQVMVLRALRSRARAEAKAMAKDEKAKTRESPPGP